MPMPKKVSSAKQPTTKASLAHYTPVIPRVKATSVVSIKVDPLMDIVRHHVRDISPATVQAIKLDFVKAFQLTVPMRAVRTSRPQRAAAAEADSVLSSQEAADLVGVSRPYMVARIDAGEVDLHQRVGNQRRVLRSSVLAWQKKEQARRRRALKQLGALLDDEIFSG